jgi:hypothetical protein
MEPDVIHIELILPSGQRRGKRASHKDYWNAVLHCNAIERDMQRLCPCSRGNRFGNNEGCAAQFDYGDYCNIRYRRKMLTPTAEQQLRRDELTAAKAVYESNSKKGEGLVLVRNRDEVKFLCITGYILVCGLPQSTIWKLWKKIKGDIPAPKPGCPMVLKDRTKKYHEPTEFKQLLALSWLNQYGLLVGDVHPVGDKEGLFLEPTNIRSVHTEYDQFCSRTNGVISDNGNSRLPYGTFANVWHFWMQENNVAIRSKKNFTTKCQGN